MKFHATVLENLLVWSLARSKALGACPRKYYYSYIGSWEGWNEESPPEVQAAYRLKHLTTPDLEIGQIVHQQIRLIFEKACAGLPIHLATEIKIAQEKFKTFIDYSRTRRLEDLTAKWRKLFCHESGKDVSQLELDTYVAKIGRLLDRFFSFEDVKMLVAEPARLIPELLDPLGFEVGNELRVPARPKTDAVFLRDDATVVVCDWKCGASSEEHRTQGLIYDLFVRGRLGLPPEHSVEIRFFYLDDGELVSYSFGDEERAEADWLIGEQFAELQSLSDDPRINTGPEERFPALVSRACFGCNHRLMCEDFLRSKFATSSRVAP